jgi:hypothetical protein
MFSDHFGSQTELLVPGAAESADSARDKIMHADAIPGLEIPNRGADIFDYSRHFVAERERQSTDWRNSGAIMRIGMTDSRGAYANQNVQRPDPWEINPLLFQWRTNRD